MPRLKQMRKKERVDIITELVTHYSSVIKEVKKKNKNLLTFLDRNNVALGICSCAANQFEVDIYNEKWVDNHIDKTLDFGGYWYQPPYYFSRKEDIIKSLKFRLKLLRKILKQPNNQ